VLVSDPIPDPKEQSGMRDVAEAPLDVSLLHPLVGVGAKELDLGDGVVGRAPRAEALTG
jgi:hypothetical protein